MKLAVILEQGPNHWGAYTPDDIGSVVVTAKLRGMREDGLPTPDVTELEIRETVAA